MGIVPDQLNPPDSVAMRLLVGSLIGGLLGTLTGWIPALLFDGEVAFGAPYAAWLAFCVVAYGLGSAVTGATTLRRSQATRERLQAGLEPGEHVAAQFRGSVGIHTPGRSFNEWPGVAGEFAVTDRRVLFCPYAGEARELRGELARLRVEEPAADVPLPPHLCYASAAGDEPERLHLVSTPYLAERIFPVLRDAAEQAAQEPDTA